MTLRLCDCRLRVCCAQNVIEEHKSDLGSHDRGGGGHSGGYGHAGGLGERIKSIGMNPSVLLKLSHWLVSTGTRPFDFADCLSFPWTTVRLSASQSRLLFLFFILHFWTRLRWSDIYLIRHGMDQIWQGSDICLSSGLGILYSTSTVGLKFNGVYNFSRISLIFVPRDYL